VGLPEALGLVVDDGREVDPPGVAVAGDLLLDAAGLLARLQQLRRRLLDERRSLTCSPSSSPVSPSAPRFTTLRWLRMS
jgi:hypothetical protein